MGVEKRLGGKRLTEELRKLATEAIDIRPDTGDPITREQKLAEMIWRQALGWSEKVRDINGDLVDKVYPPVAWCQQFLYERMEGKAPNSLPDVEGGIRAVDKVRDLAKARLNSLIKPKVGPPVHKPKSELQS